MEQFRCEELFISTVELLSPEDEQQSEASNFVQRNFSFIAEGMEGYEQEVILKWQYPYPGRGCYGCGDACDKDGKMMNGNVFVTY